jgi:hypothetical protein
MKQAKSMDDNAAAALSSSLRKSTAITTTARSDHDEAAPNAHRTDRPLFSSATTQLRHRPQLRPPPLQPPTTIQSTTAQSPAPDAAASRQVMLQQMHRHYAHDETMRRNLQQQGDSILNQMYQSNLYLLGWIVLLLLVFLLVFQPRYLIQTLFSSQERLPDRTIFTLYPLALDVGRQLPRFFLNYGTIRAKRNACTVVDSSIH